MASEPVVLIVEDEEPIAEALAFLVEDMGYTPLIACNGRAGLELARTRQPALILTDLMMPVLSGEELIRILQAEASAESRPLPPIVLSTAAAVTASSARGVDAIMRKPFNIVEVETLLRRYLGASAVVPALSVPDDKDNEQGDMDDMGNMDDKDDKDAERDER
jgi:CheY-like chemotaxis protein